MNHSRMFGTTRSANEPVPPAHAPMEGIWGDVVEYAGALLVNKKRYPVMFLDRDQARAIIDADEEIAELRAIVAGSNEELRRLRAIVDAPREGETVQDYVAGEDEE